MVQVPMGFLWFAFGLPFVSPLKAPASLVEQPNKPWFSTSTEKLIGKSPFAS